MLLEGLQSGLRVKGIHPAGPVQVVAAQWHGTTALELTYKEPSGALGQQLLYRKDEAGISIAQSGSRSFGARAEHFKLVAEAKRISLAADFDPMLAVSTSNVRPLPHQIRAVYGELLPRTPLRFLLADDPGAGKTIMAGLYVKELILRDDVKRCLIVAPGGLVEQWQDELLLKFGLRFDLLTKEMIDSRGSSNVFDVNPMLIARMDQLSRNEGLQKRLQETEWDLIIVDEAHRMGAHYFGGELRKTKRFQLGEVLGEITRHLLLMTATPHSGKEEDFQAFLTLLDRDRFDGRSRTSADVRGMMRRMVKEDLLTFEGRKLFPERVAETVPYELTAHELDLYEQVTQYVREGMNRAERVGGKRKNTIGFALTVLQRRLASSPEAIYRSLVRRSVRLEGKKFELLSGGSLVDSPDVDVDQIDGDEYSAEQLEALEGLLLDTATAARTVQELEAELEELAALIRVARSVWESGTDRKWTELEKILRDDAVVLDEAGRPRKFIIFTEHRDTLEYLRRRIEELVAKPDSVKVIHGGVHRVERRRITEQFTVDHECQFLLATDAAGEGLNLQAAHLMVNYDLPWNPNRIEQRFGRIHRIGQQNVCRLWNLVAANTREGEVFGRLLEKLDQMRLAYGGKVFDVLGESFAERPLRELLLDAIRYGASTEVRKRMHQVVDRSVGSGLEQLLSERALASEHIAAADLHELRSVMDESQALRLQPHYVELAFGAAFAKLGGRMARRERGRYEITDVPERIRASEDRPIASRYERIAFDLQNIERDGSATAELMAPGHPLHDAVIGEAIHRYADALNQGAVLASPEVEEPGLLVGVCEEVADATGASVARRFGYVFVDQHGAVKPAGPAPYLDCTAVLDGSAGATVREMGWVEQIEDSTVSWIIENRLPEYLAEVSDLRHDELAKVRELVAARLEGETGRLLTDAASADEKESRGERPKVSSEALRRKAVEIDSRLRQRLELIDRQQTMSTKPPRLVTAALVVPMSADRSLQAGNSVVRVAATEGSKRAAIDLVCAEESNLGRRAEVANSGGNGFDVLSRDSDGTAFRIAVKARARGAQDFFVTHNELIVGRNVNPRYRIALVELEGDGLESGEVRYLDYSAFPAGHSDFDAVGIPGSWGSAWERARRPF